MENAHELVNVVLLLSAAVVAVPLFKRLGLGSVLGYLAAGLAIGPFGLKLFSNPESILHTAELGVVMFLFVIGLEMRPSHLWSLRRSIFGLGTLQIAACTLVLTVFGALLGFSWAVSFVGSAGFVLTSTAIVMQLLSERGELTLPKGQKMVSILLFEDLLIVPLLALIAFLAPHSVNAEDVSRWWMMGRGILAIAALVVIGVWLLNPLFRILSLSKAREVMTAAALLVVLGAALLMQESGLSMAMGAFLAGVLLSESSFRHQIEADIEPFRGILLGLFFMGVGMSLNIPLVWNDAEIILVIVLAAMLLKGIAVYTVARITKSTHKESLHRAVLMAQGGEFAFVLFTAAAANQLIDEKMQASLSAIVILSMALTPLFSSFFKQCAKLGITSLEGVEEAKDLSGKVLLIGFGRFGQVTSQLLLARNLDVTIIDSDAEMIRNAARFGFKVYYGDGSRLDVLRASGAGTADAIAICVDEKEMANKIVDLIKSEFPQAKVLVRAYDRIHAVELMKKGVDYQLRETFESAVRFGATTLYELGIDQEEIRQIADEIRARDSERLQLEFDGGLESARSLIIGNMQKPTPFVAPRRESKALSSGTAETIEIQKPD